MLSHLLASTVTSLADTTQDTPPTRRSQCPSECAKPFIVDLRILLASRVSKQPLTPLFNSSLCGAIRHHPDLILCRKLPGIAIGRLCEKDDGKCPICDSYVRPATLVRICEECNFGSSGGKCIICGGQGVSDAYYCAECTRLEKDRDGCPKVVNLGASRTDLAYLRKARNQQQQ
ncbi:hypothetical protein PHSY_002507 [Pseudozyma hubeiensis SY62]|uniref:Pre-mRNA splicing factor ini1 n=1 Tax=Pseudozyma hubeiensis (strain SY62) TaxID=1305764 RepID=R9P1A1_PSEHS|nr:hypothetical protein PHSY_002507 [Pseudozyma hubeiensis SY62]GAC94934.1 hypothetical protein PHSY_002507 [Pseudozyma hubeiensis SY62]